MKQFTVDTVLAADKEVMDKVENTITSSQVYKLYHLDTAVNTDKVNYRTGEFTFSLCDDAYKQTDGFLKKAFLKKIDDVLNDLSIVFGDKNFRASQDRGSRKFTIQRVGLHKAVKQDVPKTFAKGERKTVFDKVVRFAEFLSKLNELTTYPNFLVTFYRRDDHGEKVNTSYEVGINRIDRSRDNYDAYIITEAARLMREITDTVTYDGFVPDMARIVAHDTGDVYNLEF